MPKCPRCDSELRGVTVAATSGLRTAVEACVDGCAGIWVGRENLRAGLHAATCEDLLRIQQGDEHWASRFDFLEVDQARRRGPKTVLTPEQLAKYIACLRCGREMMRYRWNLTSAVILDECPDGHGIWIDAGEIMQMRQFLQADTMDESHQADVRAQLSEAKRQFELDALRRRDIGTATPPGPRQVGAPDSPLSWLFGVLFDKEW